jgi:hypothetical protein
MKILILELILSLYLLVCSVASQTKLKVAYPRPSVRWLFCG